jgi:hypothetical protein
MEKEINGREIKKILKMYFPHAEFRVSVSKCGYSRAIDIWIDLLQYTIDIASKHRDLFRKLCSEGLNEEEAKRYEFYEQLKARDEEVREEILSCLKKHGIEEVVHRCEKTDEILCGGNLFISIKPLAHLWK